MNLGARSWQVCTVLEYHGTMVPGYYVCTPYKVSVGQKCPSPAGSVWPQCQLISEYSRYPEHRRDWESSGTVDREGYSCINDSATLRVKAWSCSWRGWIADVEINGGISVRACMGTFEL